MTTYLGIHIRGHDIGAALVQDGKLKYAVEEERLERFKHGSGSPHTKGVPVRSIDWILKEADLKMSDIDYITMPVNPSETFRKIPKAFRTNLKFYLNGGIWGGSIFGVMFKFGLWDKRVYQNGLNYIKKKYGCLPKVKWTDHHTAHASSAFRCSGFKKANIITMDGIGGLTAITLRVGKGKEMETVKEIMFPNSLGAFYGGFTGLLGFRAGNDEGKIQALAAYKKEDIVPILCAKTEKGDFKLDLNALMRIPILEKNPMDPLHQFIASSLQNTLEKSVLNLVEYLYEITGYKNLCLAGGVALNSTMNGKVLQSDFVDNIFIQPAAGDNGSVLGAALEHANAKFKMTHAYWGPEYSNEEIEAELKECKLKYRTITTDEVANLLAKGKIVGWHQGREELGPRALGNRSILADPSNPKMKDKVNNQVKHREPWRPFAPSILAKYTKKYLIGDYPAPFMIICFDVKNEENIIAATHVDKTARVQSVERKTNPKYYALIEEFRRLKGIPALLNTSFNIRGEPIVCSPRDSIRTFFATGLDALCLGDFLVTK